MVHEGHSKRVHGAFMRAPLGLTVVDPLGDNDLLLNIERDRLGSMRRARFEDTSALNQREYGPYGEMARTGRAQGFRAIYSNNGGDLLFGYTGHVLVNSGSDYPTYYAPYRMYNPDSARWTTQDPFGMVDGPNVYGYAAGNPVGASDPLGLSARSFAKCFSDCKSRMPCLIGMLGDGACTAALACDGLCLVGTGGVGCLACIPLNVACIAFLMVNNSMSIACLLKCGLKG